MSACKDEKAVSSGVDVVIGIPSTAAVAQVGTTKDTTRRRSPAAAANRAAALKAILESPFVQAALKRIAAARQELLAKQRALFRNKMMCATYAFTLGSLVTLAFTPYSTLGVVLFVVALILGFYWQALLLRTYTDRARAFLARWFGLKPCGDDALATGQKRSPTKLRVAVIEMPPDQDLKDLAPVPHAKRERSC
ncbi:hypothetical protein MTO96_014470 [Rhipicephalus appendiculatus]